MDFPSLASGNYQVAAVLRNGSTELARDTNAVVGVGGEYLVSIGDSISNGIGDFFAGDNTSALGRILGFQGYQAVLTDLLDDTVARRPPTWCSTRVSAGTPAITPPT